MQSYSHLFCIYCKADYARIGMNGYFNLRYHPKFQLLDIPGFNVVSVAFIWNNSKGYSKDNQQELSFVDWPHFPCHKWLIMTSPSCSTVTGGVSILKLRIFHFPSVAFKCSKCSSLVSDTANVLFLQPNNSTAKPSDCGAQMIYNLARLTHSLFRWSLLPTEQKAIMCSLGLGFRVLTRLTHIFVKWQSEKAGTEIWGLLLLQRPPHHLSLWLPL